MRKDQKVRCPRAQSNYLTLAGAAEDAMIEIRDHLMEGTNKGLDDIRNCLEGEIKNRVRSRI